MSFTPEQKKRLQLLTLPVLIESIIIFACSGKEMKDNYYQTTPEAEKIDVGSMIVTGSVLFLVMKMFIVFRKMMEFRMINENRPGLDLCPISCVILMLIIPSYTFGMVAFVTTCSNAESCFTHTTILYYLLLMNMLIISLLFIALLLLCCAGGISIYRRARLIQEIQNIPDAVYVDIPGENTPLAVGVSAPTYLTFKSISELRTRDAEKNCSVCYEEYKDTDNMRLLGCAHYYHRECVEKWFTESQTTTCPLCKTLTV